MSTSPPPTSVQAPSLQMQGICKQFGSTRALHDVSLEVHPGQVLALIGENGAGKSTLMKILSGSLTPDAGTITLAGEPYHPANPHAARMLGVSMIYQELTIAPDLSLEDNLLLGTESSHWGILNRKEQGKRIAKAQELLGLKDIPRDYPARLLSPAQQQLIEIGRTLVNDSRVVIFDEPTSSLTFEDLEHLFHVIGLLREAGLAIVYISHFLEEIRQVCQEFVVLRDGLRVGAGSLEKTTDPEIVQMMIGRELTELFPTVPRTPGEVIVKAKEVSGVQSPHAVSLELRRGEIVGIAGLIGAGRTELARCLFGLDELHGGEILIHDQPTPQSPTDRIRAGMGMVSEDRKTEGLAQNLSITENMTLSHLVPYQRWGWLSLSKRREQALHWAQTMQLKAASVDHPVQTLSGGNQQKVAIARVLHQQAEIFILDEPTRGIDVKTKSEIYRLIAELAAAGKAIIVISSYLPEIMAICDRIAVMSRGQLRAIRPTSEWTAAEIMQHAIEK